MQLEMGVFTQQNKTKEKGKKARPSKTHDMCFSWGVYFLGQGHVVLMRNKKLGLISSLVANCQIGFFLETRELGGGSAWQRKKVWGAWGEGLRSFQKKKQTKTTSALKQKTHSKTI